MAKLTLNDIQGQYASTSELNDNFTLIETAFQNTLSRDGTVPNTMSADLDMNSNDINNVNTVQTTNLLLNGASVTASDLSAVTASQVTNVAAGNIVATDVQAAINELDTEKVPETDFSAFGKTLVDDATASDARTTLGLGTVATESTVPITKGGTGQTTAQAAIDALSQVSAATNEYVLTKDTASGNALWKVSTGAGPGTIGTTELEVSQFGGEYIKLSDVKASGTAGGTFTSGAWQTRTLNTEDSDTGGHCSLASNQFTLDAGTYIIKAAAPAFTCGAHKARLRNISDSTDELIGVSLNADTGGGGYNLASVVGEFTIAATKTFEIQHRCTTTRSTDGFGSATSFGVSEVFTVVELRKVK